jgi:hypothetical protein
MDRSTSSTSQLIHLAWPVLIAQLAMMANADIDTEREIDSSAFYLVPELAFS